MADNWWDKYPVAEDNKDKPTESNWWDKYPVAEDKPSKPAIDPLEGLDYAAPDSYIDRGNTPMDRQQSAVALKHTLDMPLEAAKLTGESIRALSPAGSDTELGADYFVNSIANRNKALDEESKGYEGTAMGSQLISTLPAAAAEGPAWIAKATQYMMKTNGVAPAATKVASDLHWGKQIINSAKDYAVTIAKGAAQGAGIGLLQPTTSSDTSQNWDNMGTFAKAGALVPAVLNPVVAGIGMGRSLGRKVLGTTKEAEERAGKDLLESATDVDAAQANRQDASKFKGDINKQAEDLGIKRQYAPTDSESAQDVGTASFYKDKVRRPETGNVKNIQDVENENFAGDLTKASDNPSADKTALGKYAKGQIDTQTNTIQAHIDDLQSILDGKKTIDPDTAQALKLNTSGMSKSKASATTDKLIREEITKATAAKNTLYTKAQTSGRKVSVDLEDVANEAEDYMAQSNINKDALMKSPTVRKFLNTVDEEGNVVAPEAMSLSDIIAYQKNLQDEITSGFNSARGGTVYSGEEAQAIKGFSKQLDAVIQRTIDKGSVTNKKFAKDILAARANFDTYLSKFRNRTVPGGESPSAVNQFNEQEVNGNNPAVPQTSFSRYFFKPNEEGGNLALSEALKANPSPEYKEAASNYILDHFDTAARKDGAFSVKAFNNELDKYSETLDAVPEIKNKLMAVQKDLNSNRAAIEAGKIDPNITSKINELEAQKGHVKDSFMANVAKSLDDNTVGNNAESFMSKLIDDPDSMQKAVHIANEDVSGQSMAALKQMHQEWVQSKVLGAKGGTKGDVTINRQYFNDILNPNKPQGKALDILYGSDGAKNIRSAAELVQRENYTTDRAIGAANDSTEKANEAAAKLLASKGGIGHGAELTWAERKIDQVINREYNKVVTKALTDPDFAYKLVEAAKIKGPQDAANSAAIKEIYRSVGARWSLLDDKPEKETPDVSPEPTPAKPVPPTIKSKPFSSNESKAQVNPKTASIDAAAKRVGVDQKLMRAIANYESSLGAKPTDPNSSATGLYHFTDGTWGDMVKKYGKEYKISAADKAKPEAQAIMGALYARDNAITIKKALGRNPAPEEVYMAHFLGAGGATTLLKNYGTKNAVKLLPDAADSNKSIFYKDKAHTQARTTKEVYAEIKQRYKKSVIV